jgi:hypothetical protein
MFKHTAYGCSCGCGGTMPAYGASLKIGGSGGGGTKWEWDTALYDTCPKYKEKVNAYEKARGKYDNLPSFLGIRAGGKNSEMERLIKKMKTLKREGDAVGKKCEAKQFASDPEALKVFTPEEALAVAGGTVDAFSDDEGLGPVVYIIGAGILGLGALLGYRAYASKK